MTYHIAQVNIGKFRFPTSDPRMAGFMDQLKPINALAEGTPGFVWRLQDETGDATAIRPFPDDMVAVNFSVWESIDTLFNYVYYSDHVKLLRERKQWFDHMTEHYMVLWWIPAGYLPTLQDAKDRLEALRRDGPTPYAFTFKEKFAAPTT